MIDFFNSTPGSGCTADDGKSIFFIQVFMVADQIDFMKSDVSQIIHCCEDEFLSHAMSTLFFIHEQIADIWGVG